MAGAGDPGMKEGLAVYMYVLRATGVRPDVVVCCLHVCLNVCGRPMN